MHLRIGRLVFSAAVISWSLLTMAQTQPATQPNPDVVQPRRLVRVDLRAAMRDRLIAGLSRYQESPPQKIADLVHIGTKDGLLVANWTGPALAGKAIKFQPEGSKVIWGISSGLPAAAGGNLAAGAKDTNFNVARFDLDNPDKNAPYLVQSRVDAHGVFVEAYFGPGAELYTLSLFQDNVAHSCNLSLMGMTIKGTPNRMGNSTAADLRALGREHPEQVRHHLSPVLRALAGVDLLRPGAADVYRAFDQIAPDAATVRKVNSLLTQMDSDTYADREAASAALAQLGRPGVLASARLDLDGLSSEQRSRVKSLLGAHSQQDFDSPAAARGDRNFLLDSLDDQDLAVRKAAKTCLEESLGHPIDIDLTNVDEKMLAAVEMLRAAEQTKATTLPATNTSQPAN